MIDDIPKERSWHAKVDSMPNIARSKNGFVESLRIILEALKKGASLSTIVNIPGSESDKDLETNLIKLRPIGFVRDNNSKWILSNESEKWLKNNSDEYLSIFLNNNIKFFSEILAILSKKGSCQIKDIRIIAEEKYDLFWKTKHEIRLRLKWLRDLGLVTYNSLNYEYKLTELGYEFLNDYGFVKSEDIQIITDSTIDEEDLSVSEWAKNLYLDNLENKDKKNSIGYIPGHKIETLEVILNYLNLIGRNIKLASIIEYSKSTFNISKSSVKQFLGTLTYIELIERINADTYRVTDLGIKLLESNSYIDFVFVLDSKYKFILEILVLLKNQNMELKKLAVEAKVNHQFPNDKTNYVSKTVNVLKNAQFIQDSRLNQFKLTKRGENFYTIFGDNYTVEQNFEDNSSEEISEIKDSSLINELIFSSKDSTNPKQFEKVIQKIFELMGFKSKWLGGPGKTDVLLEAPTSPNFSYKVAVDAKANYNGLVTEKSINFNAIKEHREKHKADFSMIIGYDFSDGRLLKWAEDNEVALCTVENLQNLFLKHQEVPLKSNSYRKIFEQVGLIQTNVLKEDRSQTIRIGNLLKDVMKYLYDQVEDREFNGIVSPEIIYAMLKMKDKYDSDLTVQEIVEILDFLSSPIIGCVGKNKQGYYALGSLEDASRIFEFLLKATTDNK